MPKRDDLALIRQLGALPPPPPMMGGFLSPRALPAPIFSPEKKCPSGKIYDPNTKRCVLIRGKRGQELLMRRKAIEHGRIMLPPLPPPPRRLSPGPPPLMRISSSPRLSPAFIPPPPAQFFVAASPKKKKPKKIPVCAPHQIYNPDTNRCVGRATKKGQQLVLAQKHGAVLMPQIVMSPKRKKQREFVRKGAGKKRSPLKLKTPSPFVRKPISPGRARKITLREIFGDDIPSSRSATPTRSRTPSTPVRRELRNRRRLEAEFEARLDNILGKQPIPTTAAVLSPRTKFNLEMDALMGGVGAPMLPRTPTPIRRVPTPRTLTPPTPPSPKGKKAVRRVVRPVMSPIVRVPVVMPRSRPLSASSSSSSTHSAIIRSVERNLAKTGRKLQKIVLKGKRKNMVNTILNEATTPELALVQNGYF